MDLFYDLAYWIIEATGVDIDSIERVFVENHLGPVWSLLAELYLNPYYIVFVFPFWLAISYFWPVDKTINKGAYVLDFFYPLLTLPVHVFVVGAGIGLLQGFYDAWIPFLNTGLLDNQPVLFQAIGAFLVADFAFYVYHYLAHKVPWLWHFHAIHHSQTDVNLFTHHRIHPVEDVVHAAIRIVPISIVGGSLPAVGLYVLVNNMWGYVIHSNVRWNFGFLGYVVVSPQFHRMHHSVRQEQYDHNFGARITLWDWLFGTTYRDFEDYPETGVKGTEWICEKSASPGDVVIAWAKQMVYPFIQIFVDVRRIQVRWARKS